MNHIIPTIIDSLKAVIPQSDVRFYYFGVPQDLGDTLGDGGAICVGPISTDSEPETTGVQDRTSNSIEIVLVKTFKTAVYENAQAEGSIEDLTRIMDGRKADGSRNENSIVYVVRNNMRTYGIQQPNISINWNDTRFDKEGIVAASLRLTQEVIDSQPII